jgi:hypothetical protein
MVGWWRNLFKIKEKLKNLIIEIKNLKNKLKSQETHKQNLIFPFYICVGGCLIEVVIDCVLFVYFFFLL